MPQRKASRSLEAIRAAAIAGKGITAGEAQRLAVYDATIIEELRAELALLRARGHYDGEQSHAYTTHRGKVLKSAAEGGKQSAKRRAAGKLAWETELERFAKRRWNGDSDLSASEIAREAAEEGILEFRKIEFDTARKHISKLKRLQRKT